MAESTENNKQFENSSSPQIEEEELQKLEKLSMQCNAFSTDDIVADEVRVLKFYSSQTHSGLPIIPKC